MTFVITVVVVVIISLALTSDISGQPAYGWMRTRSFLNTVDVYGFII